MQRHHRRPVTAKRGGKGFINFILVMVLLLVILSGIFSFVNIGGDVILALARQFMSENLNLDLSAEGVSGNPIRGYTLKNFEIKNDKQRKILYAESLYGGLSFPALLSGRVKLANISIGGVSMDLDQFISEIQNFKFTEGNFDSSSNSKKSESLEESSEFPVEKIGLVNSRFISKWGKVDVSEITFDANDFNININGSINDISVKGLIDMGEEAGNTGINRSEINFGKSKIFATGGIKDGILDLHGSAQDLDLKELTALWPEFLNVNDYDGTASLNIDVTGTTDEPAISGSIDYRGSKISGYPVEWAGANVNYSKERLTVSNIQASVLNVPVNGEFAMAMLSGEHSDNPSVMIKLDGSEASLDGLDKVLKLPELKGLTGRVKSFNVNISGPVNELNGLVSFAAPKIAYNDKALTNIKAQMKLAKSNTATVDGKFNFEGAQGYLQGSIASILANQNLNLNAKIVDLDIKRVENMIPDASSYKLAGKITASVAMKGNISNPALSGSVSSPTFSGMGQTITKPVINFAFANGKLTLQKSEGTLNGMPINISGTIGPLPSVNPDLNINATIEASPAALKTYVPEISQYDLKGTVNAGVKIQGKLLNPTVNLLASSPNIQAMNMMTAKNIEVVTALNGDLTKLDKINLNAKAGSITASGLTFSDLNAELDKNGDKITLSSLNAKSGSGSITGSGSASASGKNPLNFSFKFENLALSPLAAASGIDLKGNLTGTLKISGSGSNPSIAFSGNVPNINAMGFTLSNLVADISGSTKSLKLNKMRADVEGAELNASGTFQISPTLKTDIVLNGSNINLARLLNDYPGMKDSITGIANLKFNLSGSGQNIAGKGAITSQAVKAFGLNLTNVNLPLSYSGGSFASSGGTAKLYGGTAKNNFAYDINNSKFTDQLDANGVDVNALIQDLSGGLDGKITGQGKLNLKLNGSAAKNVTYSGSGQFSMGAGAITGFKWLDIITKIHNTNGIRYISVSAPFTLQTGKLILKSGSIANANKNDPMYKYAKLTQNGIIDFSGTNVTLNLMTEGSINYQLINAITGGAKGGFSALLTGGVSNLQDGLKALLSGGIKGAAQAGSTGDFRTVNLKISGKASSPSFSSLKIGPSTLKTQTQSQDNAQQNSNVTVNKDEIINKAVDAILPSKSKTQNQQTQAQKTQAQKQTQDKDKKQQVKDKLKEELTKGLKKGLGGLFK